MRTLLKVGLGLAVIAIVAYARLAYVRHYYIHSKDAVIGEALDPVNVIAVIGMYAFGGFAGLFLIAALLVRLTHRSGARRA